jgi:two-component system chemotaxis response regulator CheB
VTVPALAARDHSRRAGPPPIRLMIVDDSPVARAVLARMVSAHADFELVDVAASAAEAADALVTNPVDIILLDLEMPDRSGLEALPELLRLGRGARILIVSSMCEDGAEAAVNALALGAADTLPKPGSGHFAGRFSEVLAERVRRLGRRAAPVPVLPQAERPVPDERLGCVAVGASTGGLHALTAFLRGLPAMIGAPILVTQHLPAVFVPFFARQVQGASGRTTRVAEEGVVLRAEEILLAPGDAHLRVEQEGGRVRVRLDREPVPSGCLPSVDPMLESVAAVYGPSGVGVMLSGMGRDGLAGSRRLVERGGAMLVQDRESCAVWGMPRAVAEAGLASAVAPPDVLARRIAARIEAGRCR